jgi:Fe-S cluster biogenesis protein NfuA
MSSAKEVNAEFKLSAKPKYALKVTKEGSGTGTVTSSPAGINCGGDCEEEYEEGKEVTLTATADPGSAFSGWSGCASEPEGKCKVTMSSAKEVTASFATAQKLSVTLEGTGTGKVKSTPAGIDCPPTCEAEFATGTAVTLKASPDPGSVFSTWKGCEVVNGRECEVTMSAAKAVKAKFTEVKTLSVEKEGSGIGSIKTTPGGISCLSACDSAEAVYATGKLITVTAPPAKGSAFVEWGGDCSGTGPCTVTMSEAKSVTAEFAPIPKLALTVNKSGSSGQGTVKSKPASVNCGATCSTQTSGFYEASVVELTATPYKGSVFTEWTGGCSGASPTCLVTMSTAKTVSAVFTGSPSASTVPLTVTKAAGTGTGKVQSLPGGVNCDAACSSYVAAFKAGVKVALKPTPFKDSTFTEWGGACSGSGACEVTMSEAQEVTAKFTKIPVKLLTVNKAGGGTGAVKSKPAGVNCGLTCPTTTAFFQGTNSLLEATQILLTATPGKGSGAAVWTGCDSEPAVNQCQVAVNSDKTVTAKFE